MCSSIDQSPTISPFFEHSQINRGHGPLVPPPPSYMYVIY